MMDVLRIFLALEILMVCAEGAIPWCRKWMPVGGSHLAQLGLMLGLAAVLGELGAGLPHVITGGLHVP